MDIPKKKVIIKVKPHVVSVGGKKPNNGGQGTEIPILVVSLRKGFLSRCIDVIRDDLHRKRIETTAIAKDPTKEWEDYKRFLEMAKK